MILPFDADGTIDWRIDRAGASVSSYAATANELYVTITDEEGLEQLLPGTSAAELQHRGSCTIRSHPAVRLHAQNPSH